MRMVNGRDGRIWFSEIGTGTVLILGPERTAILAALADGPLCRDALYSALWGVPPRRQRKQPLTDSQRASLSRALRRLRENGLICGSSQRPGLTIEGRTIVRQLEERGIQGGSEPACRLEREAEFLRSIATLTHLPHVQSVR